MCCGGKRQQMRTSKSPFRAVNNTAGQGTVPDTRDRATVPGSPVPASWVSFEYTGKTSLTVVSPVTGRHYRFQHPGDVQSVDPQDIAVLIHVPNLRPANIAR